MDARRTLLSVDWDYFMPRLFEQGVDAVENSDGLWALYDWGHSEQPLFMSERVWTDRASGFIRNDLPLPDTSGEEIGFWDRFTFAPHVRVFVAESHTDIITVVREGFSDIYNYDAHHDAGYSGKRRSPQDILAQTQWSCEDWAAGFQAAGVNVHVRCPAWRDPKSEPKPWIKVDAKVDRGRKTAPPDAIDTVFICRSGAWMPTWLDNKFIRFVNTVPNSHHDIRTLGGDWSDPLLMRQTLSGVETAARARLAQWAELDAELAALRAGEVPE